MTTYVDESSSDSRYHFRPFTMSTPAVASTSAQASVRASDEAIDITPITSSQLLEGFGDQIRKFSGISGLRSAVNTLSNHLYQGTTTNQYLVLQPVTEEDLAEIEDQHHNLGRGLRLTHCADIDTLIIKVPTPEHERVAGIFAEEVTTWRVRMGLTRQDFGSFRSTKFRGTSTSKEADECFRPGARPHRLDSPTLVFEVGVSESLPKLRNDARWWLSNSQGLVRIVLIFHVNRGSRAILIEKWECTPAARTYAIRSNRPPAQIPTQMHTITIDSNGITATPALPLVLHFQNLLLRQPTPPEQDLIFTAQDLQNLANDIWACLL